LHARLGSKSNAACELHASPVGLICSYTLPLPGQSSGLDAWQRCLGALVRGIGWEQSSSAAGYTPTQQGLSFGLEASVCSLVPENLTPPIIPCSQASTPHCHTLTDLGYKCARTAAAERAVGCKDRSARRGRAAFGRVACGLGFVACGGGGTRFAVNPQVFCEPPLQLHVPLIWMAATLVSRVTFHRASVTQRRRTRTVLRIWLAVAALLVHGLGLPVGGLKRLGEWEPQVGPCP
jgi:hypothetical protein